MRNEERGARSEVTISWKAPKNLPSLSGEGAGVRILYNVYASPVCPVDISDPRNLIATRLTKPYITFSNPLHSPSIPLHSPSIPLYFAITALDRYGNESEPLQSHQPPTINHQPSIVNPQSSTLPLLACDGKTLTLPEKPEILDANTLAIETLQGSLIATRPWRGQSVDVSRLPEGFYQLRSLGRKGVTHRLGFFKVKRR